MGGRPFIIAILNKAGFQKTLIVGDETSVAVACRVGVLAAVAVAVAAGNTGSAGCGVATVRGSLAGTVFFSNTPNSFLNNDSSR